MTPILADAIDLPVVLIAGVIVLAPLLAFNVFVEALVLKKCWQLPYRQLCAFAFYANLWSLLAGIPTKMLNAYLYEYLLPGDIPGYFARYPLALAIGSLIYFVVTLLVEGGYAFRWCRRNDIKLSASVIWRGVLLANLATYAVLAPLHYGMTKPRNEIREFTKNTNWAAHPEQTLLFIDETDRHLKAMRLDGTGLNTIVPAPMADYLVSTNLNVCLFRGTNGFLYLYRQDIGQAQPVWKTDERYLMNWVAFSPSGTRVAYIGEKSKRLAVMDTTTGKEMQSSEDLGGGISDLSVVWSVNVDKLFVKSAAGNRDFTVTIGSDGTLHPISDGETNSLSILPCYGRVGNGSWWSSGGDWGAPFSRDTNNGLTATSWPGLDSGLRIYRDADEGNSRVLTVSVRPGLLHLAGFYFGDVAFAGTPDQCVFEANGYIYLLDIPNRRLGTLAKGDRFILMTPRYAKGLRP
jgi:hypothetical protein